MSRLLRANPRTVTRIKSEDYRRLHAAIKKPNKYRAKRQKVDGVSFASQHEAKVYSELKVREKLGEITGLRLQPKYPMVVNGRDICIYFGDFEFNESGLPVCMDAKGVRTKDYRIKRKLFLALYPYIEHREV